ncbi:MAG TPA: PP2C family protein-serine/threonine phosphatase [Candidatus Baltobacteraceae bacterium]|nr:PP2C family protein-serine/threonine phosphatase [Candidatus Baltobacteraceae bacterium]
MSGGALRIGNSEIPPYQLACMEIWGGNSSINTSVELPGLRGWIHSKPLEPATAGGDVYYLSVCSAGLLSRIVLADVAGHGQGVGPIGQQLRDLVRKHINTMDQSELMRGINEAFGDPAGPGVQYATAAVLGFYAETRELVFANAGHPPALWYSATHGTWDWLHENTSRAVKEVEGLPLGLIPGTQYSQTAVRLGEGDRLILYTDGAYECRDAAGNELGYEGLLNMTRQLPLTDSEAMGSILLSSIESYAASPFDDLSLLVLGS